MALNGTIDGEERVGGRYLLESHIARGGMADVYGARDESTSARVVLKRLRPELADRPNVQRLFQREYHTLARIKHPRIIEVYDYGVDTSGPYYTMEPLDGADLRDLAPIDWKEACGYLRDVASSLGLLHTRRLLHRDLSPRNVRRTGDGHAKLLDFGTMASFGVPRDVVGTAPFMPPEALRGAALDHRADLYSLGALAYWLLTRRNAYRAKRIEDLPTVWQQEPVPPSQLVPAIPTELEDLVLSLLSMDPARRPRNAADVIERLNAIAGLASEELALAADSYLLSSELVGRDRDMEKLEKLIERALGGRGNSVLVEANPGVGRSRLLSEISLRGQLRGGLVVGLAVDAGGEPYALAAALLRALIRNAPGDAAHAAAPYLPVLMHVVPELGGESVQPAVLPSDAVEARARMQTALLAMVLELTRERPMLIVIDDFHRADSPSAALVAALARECRRHQLMVVSSVKLGSTVIAPDSLKALRTSSKTLRLHRLKRSGTLALVESLFGGVPNLDRLAAWMHDATTGNPTQTLELARHLVDTGQVRYVEGIWVLPSTVERGTVPNSLAQSLAARLGWLSPEARDLAERLSVAEGTISMELLVELAGGEDEREVFKHLDELLQKGVLEASGEGLAFVHEAMRELVADQVEVARRQQHHRAFGEALLGRIEEGQASVVAAWHLMRGGEEERGARLVVQSVGRLNSDVTAPGVLPAMEEAVRIYRDRGLPRRQALLVRTALTAAGYTHDRQLGYRYGEELLEDLAELSGLGGVSRFMGTIGGTAASIVCLTWASLRRLFTPAQERGPSVAAMVRYYALALGSVLGTMAVGIDVVGVRRMVRFIAPLGAFPQRAGLRPTFLFARGLHMFMTGREAEQRETCTAVLPMLDDRSATRTASRADVDSLRVGTLLTLGVCESYFANGRGLEVAERLERQGTQMAAMAAHRVRLNHHLMRGESELAEPHRRAVELYGVQGGTTWQVELWSMGLEALAASSAEDHIRFKQLRQSVKRMAPDVPSLHHVAELIDARMARRLGRLEESRTRLERLCNMMTPREHLSWDVARLSLSECLMSMNLPGAARDLLRETLGHYTEDDALHVVRLLCERQLALAEAACGDVQEGRVRAAGLLTLVKAAGHPLLIARVHEAGTELGLAAGDVDAVYEHVAGMQLAVEPTRNPALIALYQSAKSAADASGLSRPPDLATDHGDEELNTAVSKNPMEVHVGQLLEGAEGEERAGRLLRLVLTRANATGGYLFVFRDGEVALMASTLEREPTEVLEQAVRTRVEERLEQTEELTEGSSASVISDGDLSGVPRRLLMLPTSPDGCVGVVAMTTDGGEPAVPPPSFLRAVALELVEAD